MHDAWMVRWLCNVRLKNKISTEEPTTTLKLKSIKDFLQEKRL